MPTFEMKLRVHVSVGMSLTLATRFGLQDVKHNDEDNGDGHDEDGRHGNNESCC